MGRLSQPESYLIAGAIAAFQAHNMMHRFMLGLPNNANQRTTPPGIVMLNGSVPAFYQPKLILQRLGCSVRAVERARYFGHPTTVHKLKLFVERLFDLRSLNNRAAILSCFEAFKQCVFVPRLVAGNDDHNSRETQTTFNNPISYEGQGKQSLTNSNPKSTM